MKVRPFTSDDLPTAYEWWIAAGWPPMPPEMLPESGYIVDGLCAGWLYQANSRLAKPEWIVGNPKADRAERSKALDLLINHIDEEAKRLGYSAQFTSTKNPALIKRLLAHGYVVSDEGVTHLVKKLDPL